MRPITAAKLVCFYSASFSSFPFLLAACVWSGVAKYDFSTTHTCLYCRWCQSAISSCEVLLFSLKQSCPQHIQNLAWLTCQWSTHLYAAAPRIAGQKSRWAPCSPWSWVPLFDWDLLVPHCRFRWNAHTFWLLYVPLSLILKSVTDWSLALYLHLETGSVHPLYFLETF